MVVAGAFGGTWASATENPQPAIWKTRELTFDYFGFTTYYSCDGLRDKVEQVLSLLGARKGDLTVTPYPCTRPGRPEPLGPSVRIKVSTLEPAEAGDTNGAVEAQWKTVNLAGVDKLTPGDCELADQIKKQILPAFSTRNLQARTDCTPHQEAPGNILLTVDVLVPVKNPVSP
jgi:hypothetical protein